MKSFEVFSDSEAGDAGSECGVFCFPVRLVCLTASPDVECNFLCCSAFEISIESFSDADPFLLGEAR